MSLRLPKDPQIMATAKESGLAQPAAQLAPHVLPSLPQCSSVSVWFTEVAGLDRACLLTVRVCSKPWEKPDTSCAPDPWVRVLEVTLSLASVISCLCLALANWKESSENDFSFILFTLPRQEDIDPGIPGKQGKNFQMLGTDRQTDRQRM